MQILVTGGAGFIGSHLVKALLKQGHEVFVVDNLSTGKRERVPAEAKFIEGDIRDMQKLPLPKAIDAVFHLAAQMDVRHSVKEPAFDASVNVEGTVAVLHYAQHAGAKKMIFSSSGGAIYGPCELVPTPESSACYSTSPYGVSKYSAEQYVRLYARLHQLPYVILRYSNVYGPGQDGSKESGVIAIFSRLAAESKPLTIYGDGESTRDFVFVEDVVAANLKALVYAGSGIYNIGTGVETTVNQLATMIQHACGKKLEIEHLSARLGEELRSCLDNSLAKTELGWQPQFSLLEGLKATLAVQA